MSNQTKILLLAFCFLSVLHCQGTTKPHKNEIIDANHFYSEEHSKYTYRIDKLDKGKPLAVVIKPNSDKEYSNKVTLKLTSGSTSKQCLFNSISDLCVIESTGAASGTLEIKCESLPCEASWKIYQPQLNQLKNSETVSNFYSVQKGSKRLGILLQYKSVTQKSEDMEAIARVFSDLKFQTYSDSRSMYIFFNSVEAGHIYFILNPKYKTSTTMRVIEGVQTISTKPVQDFVRKSQKNVYSLDDVSTDRTFRFDMSFHHHFKQESSTQATISITGQLDGKRVEIRKNVLEFAQTVKNYDISFAVPKIDPKYTKIQLQVQTDSNILFLQFSYQNSQRIEVEAIEYSYFDLKKGQKLDYLLIQEPKAQDRNKLAITPSDSKTIRVSEKLCSYKKGCKFQVQALEDVRGYVYIGKGTGEAEELNVLEFGKGDSFTHKLRDQQSMYIKKELKAGKVIEVTINTPNILVYMASTKKCSMPSETCYERIGNINSHFIYTAAQGATDVMFYVKSLDTCEFTIQLIQEDTEFVQLKDSQPFVYIFDDTETEIKFKFNRQSKVDVNFNLIAPLHALDLVAVNGNKLPEDQDAEISAEGYLQFKAQNNKKNEFIVVVRKRQGFENKFVHFTLIASTLGKMIRLESGITHYETLTEKSGKGKKNNAQYIFQFNPQQDYILNFYSHNTKQQDISIKLQLKALSEKGEDKITKLVIDKSSDQLFLNDVTKELCAEVDDDGICQVAMELQNDMDLEIDIAITLLSKHNIIEMKDGLWQSYSLNVIAKSAHFYFTPRNKNNDVGINFKTTDPSVRLNYRLFYANDDQIDPSQWPFPSEIIDEKEAEEQKKFKPATHFNIGKNNLKSCWPYCVVLVSIIDLQNSQKKGNFSIMATNAIMQLPQKQKIDITLKQSQTKAYLVDLKYALAQQQNIYFYIYHSIGLTSIYANVYSERSNRVPDEDAYDFTLNSQDQIKISLDAIKELVKRQEMEDDQDLYLYVLVEGLSDSKLSIEFMFNQVLEPNEKLLSLDSMEHLMLTQKANKIFYTPIDQEYEIKINRLSGFPFYESWICKNKDIDACLVEFRKRSFSKTQQILTKVAAYTATPCQSCFYIFRVSTQEDPAELNIHLQSKTSEVELTENKPFYDFTEKEESNKYVFYAIRGEDIFVNIHITEGEVEAQLSDFHSIRQKENGKKIISFIVPGKATAVKSFEASELTKAEKQQLKNSEKNLQTIEYLKKENPIFGQALMTAFGLSDKFIQFHAEIKSADGKPSIYTISYSSGDAEFELQDGLITDYVLEPNIESTFYYSSRTAGHAYFTLSMDKSSYLKDLDISFKYCQPQNHIISDECWKEYNTQKPPVKDKTLHPTLMYSLINKNFLSISLIYKGKTQEKVSLGINHQEIVLLPYDIEFPFILHKGEHISFIVEISNPGYIEILTRKCDESNPTFSYTFDYSSFQKDEFTYESELGTNPKNRYITKVQPGTLYMKMQTPPDEQAMVSIYVKYSQTKIRDPEVYPGGKGDVDYAIVDSTTAELKIKPPSCSEKNDCNKIKYFLMVAPNMRDLYSQLVCPSNFFSNLEFYSGEALEQKQIKPSSTKDGILTFSFALPQQISYVGIKAQLGSSKNPKQVFYKPIEVATLWGQLSRTSHTHKLAISTIFIISLLSIIICVRRSARNGYRPITEDKYPDGDKPNYDDV